MTADVAMGPAAKDDTPRPAAGTTTSVQCGDCGAVFSRAEHLTRHRRSHTNERPFVCSDCGKSFSRVDVLTRHAASHHEEPPSPARDAGVFPRACRECAASRVRCSRGDPCNRCSRKNLHCAYPTARKRRASEEGARRASRPPGEPIHHADQDRGILRHPEAPGLTPALGMAVEPSPGQVPWMLLQQEQPTEGSYLVDRIQPPDEACAFDAVPVPDAAMSAMNWLSPDDNVQLDWAAHLAANAGGFEALGFPFLADMDLPAEQLAWPAPRVQNPQVAEAAEEPQTSTYVAEQSSRSTSPPRTSEGDGDVAVSATSATSASMMGTSTVGMFYVDGKPWRAPLKASPTRRRSTRSVLGLGDERTPPLSLNGAASGIGEGSCADSPPARVYDAILSKIKAEAPLWEGQYLDLTNYPSPSQMQTFFGLYFECFHHTAPFLRRDASFYELPCHWVLLLALCAIGSRYCPAGSSSYDSSLLFNILGRVLCHRAGSFPFETPLLPWATPQTDSPDDDDAMSLLQAAILNLIWKVHGGRESAGCGVLAERHKAVVACQNMGLLGDAESERAAVSRDWWEEQSRTRTGLMIWLLDSILEYEIGSQALLRLGDIKVSLPCRERLWEEPHPSATPQESSQTIHDALEVLYIEKKLPPTVSDFGVTLLTHAVCRRSTEAVHQHQIPLASWVPTATTQSRTPSRPASQTWPPSLPILSRWRNSACDCLDVLHLHANSIIAKGWGWEPPAVLHLHLSRMLILAPVASLQALASAASLPRRGRGVDAAGARGKVLRWAIDDQYKARLAVIHAGSTFWHVRRHSADSFLEPFTVFLATLVLWAYSTSVQFANQQNLSNQPEKKPMPPSARESDEGEMEEDAEPPFLHLDRPLDDEAVQAYVRLGDRVTGYLSRVGDLCKEGAPRRIVKEGRDILLRRRRGAGGEEGGGDGGRERGFVWGVAVSYVETLGYLVQSLGE